MSIIELLLVAAGLSMDAFAVSVTEGIIVHRISPAHTLRVAMYFGLSQGAMPLIGYLGGARLRLWVEPCAHWVAFGLLVAIGGKMIVDAVFRFETAGPRGPSSRRRLLVLAGATSVDALVVGVVLGLRRSGILLPAAVIAVVTGVICTAGMWLGERVSSSLSRWAEVMGGTVLCLIGCRILLQHLL